MTRQAQNPIHFEIIVAPEEEDGAYRDEQARLLRDLIEDQVDGAKAELVRSGKSPEGARAGEVVTLGHIALAVLPVAVTGLLGLLRDRYKARQERRYKIKVGDIEVELPGEASWEEAERRVSRLLELCGKADA